MSMPPYRFTALKLYPPIFAVLDTVCVDGLLLHILRACPGSVPVALIMIRLREDIAKLTARTPKE